MCIYFTKIPKGQTEFIKSEDKQGYGQQNEKKEIPWRYYNIMDKRSTHNFTPKTKA